MQYQVQKYLNETSMQENEHATRQVTLLFQNGGDKRRLTLINMSTVRNWWDPEQQVWCSKEYHILLVFCNVM